MSRRKQLKPQHIQINDLSLNRHAEDTCLCCDHVCRRCCPEFSLLSDLEQHQTVCSPDPPVLIVSEDEDVLSISKTLPAASAGPAGELGETVLNFEMENKDRSNKHAEFMNYRRSSHGSAESSGNSCSNQSISGTECKTDTVLCTSVHPEGCSWRRNKVFIENLESTKVTLAQFSQLMDSDSHHSKTSISSLLQQLLTLQIQQIHQLQLMDHIRHQVLLFASHLAKIPDTLLICTKDLPSSDPFSQLRALSAHLSQELAAASARDKFLSNQSQCNGKDVLSSSESSQTFSKLMVTAFHKHVSKEQHMDCGSADTKLNFLSQTKTSSLMFGNNSFPNISAIVEDLDALAALAQQRKCKNLKLFAPNMSSTECLCKHKCRFCSKVFGKDSALQIHLQSHTGERPYRCNVCGNGFSTRGNLKVHFERHKERHPLIKMNVPEHNIQTNAGIPFGMSLSSETAAARLFDSSPPSAPMSPPYLEQSDSTNMSPVIKKEDDLMSVPVLWHYSDSDPSMDFLSKANSTKTSDSAETNQQRTMNLKSEGVKASFNISKMVTTKSEESVDVIPNLFPPPTSTSFSGLLSLKRSDKVQLLSDTAGKRVSDLNECVTCQRVLSCQSALRMHHRTHTGERPYQCQFCGRAFTTKGNLNTHQAVHRATVPLSVQHSCPICQSKFTNAVVLQQHVHMHMEGHLPNADCVNQKYSVDYKEGFGDKTKWSYRKKEEDDNNGAFCDNRLSTFKSLSIHLSPLSKNLTDANKRTSYDGPHGELQFKWIKTERSEGSNEECCQTNNRAAAESGQRTRTLSNSSASERSLSLSCRTSMSSKTASLNEPFETWLDSTALMLQRSATVPTDQKTFNSLSVGHNLREKGVLKNNYCNICGKNFACQSALDIHYRSHTKERPFICTTCNRGFSTKGNLKQHMLTHQMRDFPSNLFKPSTPNEAPNHDSSMLSMLKTDMNSSAFSSGKLLPGQSQSSSVSESPFSAVTPARRTPKQHRCRTCGKSFSSSSALQIHERTHTGERPFACAVCGRAFTTKGNLKVHMGTHMWNSAPSRRGCRLSVDRLSLGIRTRPVKLPEPPQKNPAVVSNSRESVYCRKKSPEVFSAGLRIKDVCVSTAGHLKEKTAVKSCNVCVDTSDRPQ